MRPIDEETLSYLTGLAPVGEPLEVPMEWVKADLGFRCRQTWYLRINALIAEGCVRRLECGSAKSTGVFIVTRPLERGRVPMNETKRETEARYHQERKQATEDNRASGFMHVARLPRIHEDARRLMEEIPADTRGLTARLMGDPIPGRGALGRMREMGAG
jgi:hypothetical protein